MKTFTNFREIALIGKKFKKNKKQSLEIGEFEGRKGSVLKFLGK